MNVRFSTTDSAGEQIRHYCN